MLYFEYNSKNTFYTIYDKRIGNELYPTKISTGTFVLDFLALDLDDIRHSWIITDRRENGLHEIKGYHESLTILQEKYNKYLIDLILKQLIHIDLKYMNAGTNVVLDDIIDSMISTLKSMQNDIKGFLLTGKFERDGYVGILSDLQHIEVSFSFDKDYGINSTYLIKDIFSLISLDLINVQNHNIIIKKCENCHNFFIPLNRTDEIYCNRIFKNGKTCKQVGYEEKEKKDPFKRLYTTARKTQHARIRYNSHITDYKEKHYEPWKSAAKKALNEFRENNDISGFENWLHDHRNSF